MRLSNRDYIVNLDSSYEDSTKFELLQEHELGILIRYVTPKGKPLVVSRDNKPLKYEVVRLSSPKEGEGKYQNPYGVGTYPFLPPMITNAVREKKEIRSLILTEGQFKALVSCANGIPCIGFSGIHNIKSKDKKALHPFIIEVIKTCKVEHLVYLLDADAKSITPQLEAGKDLYPRLAQFASAIQSFLDLGSLIEGIKLHPVCIQKNLPKGLDDLLLELDDVEPFVDDFEFIFDPKFTKGKYLEGIMPYDLGVKSVNAFYQLYKGELEDTTFIYRKGTYRERTRINKITSEPENYPHLIDHQDSSLFLRVAGEYYKRVTIPTNYGSKEELCAYKKSEIAHDYVKGYKFKFPDIFYKIQSYDSFCNIAGHGERYREVIKTEGCTSLNLYTRITHVPTKGKFDTIFRFIRHIFGTTTLPSGKPRYELGLDYLTILWRHPVQKLPILGLVSKERGTGKTTFGALLREIFQSNVSFCSNEDFAKSFNSHFAKALVAVIDEGFIEKKAILEKLKSWSTSPTISFHPKGKDEQSIDCLLKFVFTSNDEDNFIRIDQNETRFLVLKVPKIEKENPSLMEEMKQEIPAFLHYLSNRKIIHPRKTRMWFDYELLETDALKRVKGSSKKWIVKDLESLFKDLFDYAPKEVETIHICVKDIQQLFKERQTTYKPFFIKEALQRDFNLKPLTKVKTYSLWVDFETKLSQRKGRAYTLHRERFAAKEVEPNDTVTKVIPETEKLFNDSGYSLKRRNKIA